MKIRVLFVILWVAVIVCLSADDQSAVGARAPTALPPARQPVQTDATRPNIILIVVDALRPDHLSSYGYQRQTSPNLDALVAGQGVQFQDATATAPWTYPSNAALFTGQQPTHLGATTWDPTIEGVPSSATTMAEHLRAAGYRTAAVVTNYYVSGNIGFAQGFDHFDDRLANRPRSEPVADDVNRLAQGWLQANWSPQRRGDQPLFLLLYYYDPHTWYNPPPPYDTMYDPNYSGTMTPDVYQDGHEVMAGTLKPTARDVEHLLALYDGEIAYTDLEIGRMMTYLEQNALLDNALVAVTSDHGEMFGEHDKWGHGTSLYEETLRVPLLMRYSGVIPPGLKLNAPVSTIDVLPTVLDLAGLEIPTGLSGLSLRPLIDGSLPALPRAVYSEVDGISSPDHWAYKTSPRWSMRSVRRGDEKLIENLGENTPDELYHLNSASIYETNNLIATDPALARELRDPLHTWFGYSGLQYFPLPHPIRLLDTRPGAPLTTCDRPGQPVAGNSTRSQVARVTCDGVTIPASAQSLVGNVTAVNTLPDAFNGLSYLTLYPTGVSRPTVSNLNFVKNQVVPNAFTVGLGGDGAFNIYAPSPTHVIIDVAGYYARPSQAGLYYHPLPYPIRLLDTRPGAPAATCDRPGQPVAGNSTRAQVARVTCDGVTIPASAQSLVGNVTAVNTLPDAFNGLSYLTLYPTGVSRPTVSNLNFVKNQVVPNAFTVGLGDDGAFNIYAPSSTHVIVDVAGYFSVEPTDSNGPGLLYEPLDHPIRLLDTRPGAPATTCDRPGVPLAGNSTRAQIARVTCDGVTIPASSQSLVGNVTAVNTLPDAFDGLSYLTLYPTGVSRPTVSNLNFVKNQVVPNAFTVGLGDDGAFNIYAPSSTHAIVDVAGYFRP